MNTMADSAHWRSGTSCKRRSHGRSVPALVMPVVVVSTIERAHSPMPIACVRGPGVSVQSWRVAIGRALGRGGRALGRALRDLDAGSVKSARTDPAAALGTGVGARGGLTRLNREPFGRRLRLCQIPLALEGIVRSRRIASWRPANDLDNLLQFGRRKHSR